jgi:hypothetical protein
MPALLVQDSEEGYSEESKAGAKRPRVVDAGAHIASEHSGRFSAPATPEFLAVRAAAVSVANGRAWDDEADPQEQSAGASVLPLCTTLKSETALQTTFPVT